MHHRMDSFKTKTRQRAKFTLEQSSTTFCNSISWSAPPTKSNTDAAIHLCPEQPAKLTVMSDAVDSNSQSGRAIKWFLAPPRDVQRLCNERQRVDTISATGDEPTKVTALTSGLAIKASDASLSPLTKLKTPGGTPASCINSAMRCNVMGTFSLGLQITVFPMTRAIGIVHIGTFDDMMKMSNQEIVTQGQKQEAKVKVKVRTIGTEQRKIRYERHRASSDQKIPLP